MPPQFARLDLFLSMVWPQQRFLLGESTLDLWVLCIIRVVIYVALPAARALRRLPRPQLKTNTQLSEPLNLNSESSDATTSTAAQQPRTSVVSQHVAVWVSRGTALATATLTCTK